MFTAKLGTTVNFAILDNTAIFYRATYGSIWNFWLFTGTEASSVAYAAQIPNKIAMVGTKYGKGTLLRGNIADEGPG